MISHNNMVTITNKKLLYNIWTHTIRVGRAWQEGGGAWQEGVRGVAGGCEGCGRRSPAAL